MTKFNEFLTPGGFEENEFRASRRLVSANFLKAQDITVEAD